MARRNTSTVDKVRPATEVNLGGKTRRMVMDLNAMCTAEELTGKSLMKKETWDKNNIRLGDLRAFVFAALNSVDESVTLREVGSWINLGNFEAVMLAFQAAMKKAGADADETAETEGGEGESDPLENS